MDFDGKWHVLLYTKLIKLTLAAYKHTKAIYNTFHSLKWRVLRIILVDKPITIDLFSYTTPLNSWLPYKLVN